MTNLSQVKWHVMADGSSLARDAASRIIREARAAIGDRGKFSIVMAGGNTPQHTYQFLSRSESDWSRWHVYFGDERCVARSDERRNSLMVLKALLRDVPIPKDQIHEIQADAGFDVAISAYEKILRRALPFDLVLLGLGEDGHTASLFPGRQHDPAETLVAVHDSPKEPPERVSMNYPTLNEARKVLVLVEGENKREAVRAWLAGDDLPISRITGLHGIDVLIDRSAYPD